MSSPLASSFASDAPVLTRLGRFHITRELGRGSLGCVYLGHDPVVGRDIAIKTFNPRLTAVERSRHAQKFLNEARSAGLLSHPHIVTVYDACVENGMTYIAMEYLQGRELDKMLGGGHRFLPDEAASIAWRIADALKHAHQRQVIHRDIKPSNIFMVGDEQPKLLDFGIARAPNRIADGQTEVTEDYTIVGTGQLVGTPNYMSPEQAAGKPVDARTDIYSLGAVMYEMLTGRKPFQSGSADKLLLQIACKAPTPPDELDARIPAALSRIVMKAMSKRPEKRYQDAEQMALDIKRYLLRQRRARRRMNIPVPALDQRDSHSAGRARLAWLGYLSVASTIALAGLLLLR